MRILVFSDTHRRYSAMENAIFCEPQAKHIFFLGDVLADIDEIAPFFPDRVFHTIYGNCDSLRIGPPYKTEVINGIKIVYTHGHMFNVKWSPDELQKLAIHEKADIVLYGHTHIAKTEYDHGVYFINPGSVSEPRGGTGPSYAAIDIVPSGIMPIIKPL